MTVAVVEQKNRRPSTDHQPAVSYLVDCLRDKSLTNIIIVYIYYKIGIVLE